MRTRTRPCKIVSWGNIAILATWVSAVVERFVATIVLGGVGDTLGYKSGEWGVCGSGRHIHNSLVQLGGKWPVSDDIVMQIATAEALVDKKWSQLEAIVLFVSWSMQECMKDMVGHASGLTCQAFVRMLNPSDPNSYIIS